MLTVSVPTFNTPPELLERALRSILASPQVDRVVVVNDGGRTPETPADSRIVVYSLSANRGRYFCDAIVTRAVNGWWSPHDADDWSHPRRWDGYRDHPATLAGHVRHRRNRRTTHLPDPAPLGPTFTHAGHWCAGVYHTERIARAGGVLPQFAVGFDTLFLLMVRLTGQLHASTQVAYHYMLRHGSLTSSPHTGRRSQLRAVQAGVLRELYDAAWESQRNGDDPAEPLRASIPPNLDAEVDVHTDRLVALLC